MGSTTRVRDAFRANTSRWEGRAGRRRRVFSLAWGGDRVMDRRNEFKGLADVLLAGCLAFVTVGIIGLILKGIEDFVIGSAVAAAVCGLASLAFRSASR